MLRRPASVLFLIAAGCSSGDVFLPLPPPLSSRAFLFALAIDGKLEVSAHDIAELETFSVRNMPVLDQQTVFAIKYFDAPLEVLSIAPGPISFANPGGGPSRPIPVARATYVARTDGRTLGGWVRAELAGDPLDGLRLPCGPTQHDGGDGACADRGACSAGYFLKLDGTCQEACDEFSMLVLDCSPYAVTFASEDLGGTARGRLGDLDGDGSRELVITSYNRVSVFRLDGLLPRQEATLFLGDHVQAAYGIGIGDADRDGAADLLVGSWRDDVFQLGYRGTELEIDRRISRFGYGNWMIEVLDVDGQPGTEVLISNRYGHFHALRWNGAGYDTYWSSPLIGNPNDTTGKTGITGIGDTDGDGRLEVQIYSTQGICELWEAGTDGFVRVFHFEMATSGVDGADSYRALLADVDGDRRPEVFCGDQYGLLKGFRFDGSDYVENFSFMLDFDPTTLAIADVDVDPALEMILGSDDGRTVVLDLDTLTSTRLEEFGTASRWIDVADFDGDGKSELIVGYESGILRIFRHR